jgi:histidinol-phosphate aminotransferase
MTFYNPGIKKITPYVGGKAIEELSRQMGLKTSAIVKLASNENPLGPSPKALEAIRSRLKNINRYPDSSYFRLTKVMAKKIKLAPSCLAFGNGSDELIDVIIKGFSSVGDEVLSAKMTFLEYGIITKVNGRRFKSVALRDFRYDLAAMAKAISSKTRIIFIANPNNPTGTYVGKEEVVRFLKRVPPQVLVVFDEAYNEFIDVKDFPQTQNLIKKYNCISLRTFSKAYGLAGLRIGYALANLKIIRVMNTVRQPFNVNFLADIAACAAISDRSFVKRTQELIWREKAFLYEVFDMLGISYVPSVANFILIRPGRNTNSIINRLLKRGVIVRGMAAYGLANFIRVTIGTRKENLRFIEALKKVLKKG